MYDIRRLRMLLEIHERGTVAAAAAALHLTPSAISQQISTLEKEVGCKLLRHVGRRVQLTEEALIIVEGTALILREMDAIGTRVAQLSGEAAGTIKLALFQSAAVALLGNTLSHLSQHAPKVVLEVDQIDPESGLALTKSREFDIVITESYPHHYIPEHSDLYSELLTTDPIQLVVPAGRNITTLKDARDLPFVLEGRHNTSRTWAINQCRAAGFEPQIRYDIEDLLTHFNLTKTGFAAAILPGFITSSIPDLSAVDVLPLPHYPERKIMFTTRIDTTTQPAIMAVKDALLYACSQL